MARRIHELDALRGLALAGIVEFNIVQMTGFPRPEGPASDHPGAYVWEALFLQRPFPIFSLLFGVSFALFLRTAGNRTDKPRLVLLRRLLWLGVFSALHTLLQPGEVLKFYAAFGIVVLLPASYLSRRWVLGLGVVLTLAASLTFNGLFIIPGLFLLGMAVAQYGIPDTLDRRGRQLGIAFAVTVPPAAAMLWLQWRAGVGPAANYRILPAGTVCAFLFTVSFLLLMRTPLRRPLDAVLAPMGRMALTNYVLASVLILAADALLDLGHASGFAPIVATGAVIGVVQALLSVLWLRWFRYGPLEWLWRCLTWWTPVPIRAEPARADEVRGAVTSK
ncbi:membrane protein [Paractinoplanes abujensis]|uniref:Putative membrane protein YeiB n=1 Tax=Paractinoplanes abujensis TaxID=882441 RepID=A0A7W7CSC3_9ACTN|nr:DUF418 domain-containing protein [Actinoplanes abujensis]MBB4692061.1 putative membrane protein YeiB [Actinoplanes abujensis]GID16522.1 membrane protein [Actinoplanes abujensis]